MGKKSRKVRKNGKLSAMRAGLSVAQGVFLVNDGPLSRLFKKRRKIP
jgi:hypothetical protein